MLDIVVNNAGIFPTTGPMLNATDDFVHRMLDVNLRAHFSVARESAKRMTGGGSIVNMASVAALGGGSNISAYSASKAGVVALTRAFARELGPLGIRVEHDRSGIIDTPGVQAQMAPLKAGGSTSKPASPPTPSASPVNPTTSPAPPCSSPATSPSSSVAMCWSSTAARTPDRIGWRSGVEPAADQLVEFLADRSVGHAEIDLTAVGQAHQQQVQHADLRHAMPSRSAWTAALSRCHVCSSAASSG